MVGDAPWPRSRRRRKAEWYQRRYILYQFLDRTRDIPERHVRIDTMLVEQVYRIHSQSF